ncbi:MAG: LuxR family transcriptional regulator [Cytophagales bacterium]|nr:MAG: LuxR family transcriptional regulator [Cytophagales bacterium]
MNQTELTNGEWNIFRLLVENPTKTNVELGEMLNCSQHTIAAHVRSILTKLDIESRYELLPYAIRSGLYCPRQNCGNIEHKWEIPNSQD